MRQGLSKDLIARILGGAPKYTLAELEEKFPPRNLPDGAMVTRFAPSPTGFMHLGNLYSALIDKKLAHQTNGVFMLRIEDTDTKREVDGAVQLVIDSLKKFGLKPDEMQGFGKYGPYFQSERKEFYHSIAAELLATGRAYPCFLTSEDMDEIRKNQTESGYRTGIYGEWASWRNMDESEIVKRLEKGETPSIRLYSTGDFAKKIYCKDMVRGSIAFPENDEDIVLVKSNDGLPTYHFAHLCDDHFMRTTNVVRGEEWLPSLPLHVQLFNMMGWNLPAYIHTSTIDKIDLETGKQRKFSKRKDPEFNLANTLKEGWPTDSVLDYFFNIVASGYEEAKIKGQVKNIWEYELRSKKIPTSSALFNMEKLEWWAREFIATLSVDELTQRVIDWADEYSPEWKKRIHGHEDYLKSILSIERENPKRIRKDFVTWKQTLSETEYFWDELFVKNADFEFNKNVLDAFIAGFDVNDDKDTWWNKIVEIANSLELKNGDVAMNLRVALTGRTNTPDLYSIMQVMGHEMVIRRIKKVIG